MHYIQNHCIFTHWWILVDNVSMWNNRFHSLKNALENLGLLDLMSPLDLFKRLLKDISKEIWNRSNIFHNASYPLRVATPGEDRHWLHQHSAQIWSRCLGRRQIPEYYLARISERDFDQRDPCCQGQPNPTLRENLMKSTISIGRLRFHDEKEKETEINNAISLTFSLRLCTQRG